MSKRRNQRGAAAVEFALVLPIFIFLVFGIIQYGFYFWTAETANSAAREAARRVVVGANWSTLVGTGTSLDHHALPTEDEHWRRCTGDTGA